MAVQHILWRTWSETQRTGFLKTWLIYFQILDKTQDDVYKGVHSTAISKTIAYYRLCMDEQAINDTGIAPALQVCWMKLYNIRPSMTPVSSVGRGQTLDHKVVGSNLTMLCP